MFWRQSVAEIASLCKSNFMLQTSIILAAVWLSVNHLTNEPCKIGAKDSRAKTMAARSLQVELLEHSEGSQSLWHTQSLLRVITDPHPAARSKRKPAAY